MVKTIDKLERTDTTDYKTKSAILEAELSQAKKEIDDLNFTILEFQNDVDGLNEQECDLRERLEPFEGLFPTLRSLADINKLQRLFSLTSTITEKQLTDLGV